MIVSEALQSVDLVNSDGFLAEGLIPVGFPPQLLAPGEASILRQVESFEEVSFVFFRRFSDGRSSQPLAFIIENEDEHLSNEQLAKIHNDLWLHGVAPLVYVTWSTRIDILSCVRGPDFWENGKRVYHPAEQLKIASKVEKELRKKRRFSANRLADGTFWEDPKNHSLANHEKSAHQLLIQAIVDTDRALNGESNPTIRRLLLLTVLIKYLEDRKVFPGRGWFGRFSKGARSFLDVLKSGRPYRVLRLLKTLEARFNGDVFAIPSKAKLTKETLSRFAQLIESKTIKHQRYLWEQYSFSHLPVEVISNLYQRFVSGKTAVYTPPFLAAAMLDYAMPYEKLTGNERVLDPACGSGVFLVSAFRRLVSHWRAKNKGQNPDVQTLKKILKNQIYGVELDSNSVDLTIFSLALAVCDSLKPNVIWNELRFDPLKERNIFECDFFSFDSSLDGSTNDTPNEYDVIVGNPPFESELSKAGRLANFKRASEGIEISDNQVAYLFLDVSLQRLKNNGNLCLIQPSGFLYNNNSHSFRSTLAKTGRLKAILDYTSIRGLFSGADVKTIAILAGDDGHGIIDHLTFRRTYEAEQQIGFELDHYDRNQLSVDEIVEYPSIARANLLGGGRLKNLAKRLSQMPSLRKYVEGKGWLIREGYIKGKEGSHIAPYITDQPHLPTSALIAFGIDKASITKEEGKRFVAPRVPEIYDPPLVLIRAHESLPNALWEDSNLTYKDKIVGIHAPLKEIDGLRRFYKRFQKNQPTYRFSIALNGSQALVGKATALLKRDIDSLPFPKDQSELKFTFWEEALAEDTTDFFTDYVRLGAKSTLLKHSATEKDMETYASFFCEMLGSMFENLRYGKTIFLNGLICQVFYFGTKPNVEWLNSDREDDLTNLVYGKTGEALRTNRIVRFYYENAIVVIKPNRIRYWIRSTAIRDADDTLIELQLQGY